MGRRGCESATMPITYGGDDDDNDGDNHAEAAVLAEALELNRRLRAALDPQGRGGGGVSGGAAAAQATPSAAAAAAAVANQVALIPVSGNAAAKGRVSVDGKRGKMRVDEAERVERCVLRGDGRRGNRRGSMRTRTMSRRAISACTKNKIKYTLPGKI